MRRLIAIALLSVAATSACRETTLVPPRSLDSPTAVAVARGEVCLRTFEDADRVLQFVLEACDEDEFGAIGLIANEQSDRLALMDLSIGSPRLIDLDPATPGPNHVEVGRLPVDVAASPDGTAAYTLNQLDRDVSIVNLWGPQALASRYNVDETPIAMDVDPGSGEVVVAAGSPSRLYGFDGASFSDADDDDFDPSAVTPRTLELPGTVSDIVFSPAGDELWVVYRDLDYASVVSFAPTEEGFDTPCLNGTEDKPCVTSHVSLVAGCADGLDNDGDGLVDQEDIQCFGPTGAESAGGIGRLAVDACANGIDDDEDGLVDRDDPECLFASGIDEAVAPVADVASVCGDDTDNDGDGSVDYPSDDACYGALGRTEETVRTLGFDTIGIDSHGVFAYVVDRVGEQVLVIDARAKQLIDAPAAQQPGTDIYDDELGVDISPSPLSIQGAIERSIQWEDPDDDEHVVVRYDFGAWVSGNNGTMQYVDTAVAFCEFTGDVVANDAFWRGEQGDAETECLQMPRFPLESGTARAVATDALLPESCTTEEFVACATCLEAGEEETCAACDIFADTQFDLCQRAFVTESTNLYVNPRFALRDGGGDDGRLLGSGTCEQPDELITALQEYATANPAASQSFKCDSPLMPQPLEPSAAVMDAEDESSGIEGLSRLDLLELRTLQFDTEAGNEPVVGFRPADQRIISESITVTYEGVIPGTSRADGVFRREGEDGTYWLDVGFNPCSTGIEVGDHLLITSEPVDNCATGDALEFEIVERTDSEVRLALIDGATDEFPSSPNCFSELPVGYEVRATDEWTVVGETSGFLSPYDSAYGSCVPRYGAERLGSRVATGEQFVGPYYSFYLYPSLDPRTEENTSGIAPVRDTAYTIQVNSGFSAVRFSTCSSLGQRCAAGLFPAQVVWAPGLPSGTLLISPDPNDNFIHVRNLSDAAAGYSVIR